MEKLMVDISTEQVNGTVHVPIHVQKKLHKQNTKILKLEEKLIKSYNKILEMEYIIRKDRMPTGIVEQLKTFIISKGLLIYGLRQSTSYNEHELFFKLNKIYETNKFGFDDIVYSLKQCGIIVEHKPPYTFIFKRNL